MSEFWSWDNYVSWEHCIEANRICNLENCPELMNCCMTNCVGMPTIKLLVIIFSITAIVLFFIGVAKVIKDAKKEYENQEINKESETTEEKSIFDLPK